MAGTSAGAEKQVARLAGVTVAELRRRRRRQEKWCYGCRSWHPLSDFGRDITRYDGLNTLCRATKNARARARHVLVENPKPRGPRGGRHTAEARRRMSEAATGRPNPRKGEPRPLETRQKISATLRRSAVRGAAVHALKDGKVADRRGERHSAEYKRWRYDVFTRDNFTCKHCGDDKGGNLVAHHLKSFADFPALRFDLANGLTLCEDCHTAHHREHGYG